MAPLEARDPGFIGPYRLLARLGEGGMGRVYLGLSAGRRIVAVKVIHADHARDPEFRERFKIEVAAAKKVQAAFTAPVIDAGEDDDPPWLVTSLVEGPSLADVVKSQGPLPAEPVWRLVAGLAEALAAVHACDIVHRDVTPGNVLLAIDGPRLIDFGLARALGSSNMTATGIVIGTPAFLSPEHVRGDPVGPASDIFSLGSLVVFAATGTGPFGSGEPIEVLGRILAREPDLGGLSGALGELAAACLAEDPAGRPVPAEIIRSLPSDSASLASGPATRFWPAPLDAFIRSYQASFGVALPDLGGPGEQATLSFKPPKAIAAEAASLTERGRPDDARQLLAVAAGMRPDQEVAALIALLRAEGRHADAEAVIKAALRRPASEVAALARVLQQIGSDRDADILLDQAADGSAEQIGAVVVALAGTGQGNETRRRKLLRSAASTAPRRPQGIVTLVGVLSSAGMGEDVTRFIAMVTPFVSTEQAAALGDALRGSGYHEAALSLYAAALDVVAAKPPYEVAPIWQVILDEKRDDLATRLVELLTIPRVIVIAESLLAAGQQEAALSVCGQAAAKDPSAAGALIDALRDIGRPVDAYRLLENLGTSAVGQAAEVIAGLRQADRSDDADRVLRAFLRQGPEPVCDLVARLGQLGVSEDGAGIAAVLDPGEPDLVGELAGSFIRRQAYVVADHLLARAAQESALRCCELIDASLRTSPAGARQPVKGSDFPEPTRMNASARPSAARPGGPESGLFAAHWQAHDNHGGLLRCLRRLRSERLGVAAHELLSYVAQRPVAEVARFASELDWVEELDGGRQTRTFWSRTSEAAVLIAATAQRYPSDVGTVITALTDRPHDSTYGRWRLATTELMAAISAYPRDVVVTVAMGLKTTAPDLLTIFARTTASRLPEILAGNFDVDQSRLADIFDALLKAAGNSLAADDFCHLYLNLRNRFLSAEASLLLTEAATNPVAPDIIEKMKSYGYRREAKLLGRRPAR